MAARMHVFSAQPQSAPILPLSRGDSAPTLGGDSMNLAFWLPAMLVLGLAMIGLMFAFVIACAKI
jgi:hypothetical protein